jgi:hypothetical protein
MYSLPAIHWNSTRLDVSSVGDGNTLPPCELEHASCRKSTPPRTSLNPLIRSKVLIGDARIRQKNHRGPRSEQTPSLRNIGGRRGDSESVEDSLPEATMTKFTIS